MKELYGISEPTFYKIYNRILSQRNEKCFEDLMKEIENDFDISYCPLPLGRFRYPSQLVITNNAMRAFYKKYGRLVSFDLTFNLFKEIPL